MQCNYITLLNRGMGLGRGQGVSREIHMVMNSMGRPEDPNRDLGGRAVERTLLALHNGRYYRQLTIDLLCIFIKGRKGFDMVGGTWVACMCDT